MATTTTKTGTKKPASKSMGAIKETPVDKKTEKKKFDRNDDIECVSVTVGGLTLVGAKTKDEYRWENYGDTTYVKYEDLQSLYTTKSPFLTYPLFMILDEELVNQWSSMLGPIYNKINDQDIDNAFTFQPSAFKSYILNAPDGIRESIKTRAGQKINDGTLYDIRLIKIIDEVLETSFVDLVV